MDRKLSSKGCSEVKQVAVSTLQEQNILQKQQSFFQQNHMNILASLENNQSFYSIAVFFVRLTILSERNVSFQEEKSIASYFHFIAPD